MKTAKPVVLVAEDSEHDLFFIEQALGEGGVNCTLQIARDGQEALDYLEGAREFADRKKFPLPVLVLTDLKMPRLDGYEVLARIQSCPHLDKLPVIVLTNSTLDQDRSKVEALGATYVVKDVLVKNRADLAEIVRQRLPGVPG